MKKIYVYISILFFLIILPCSLFVMENNGTWTAIILENEYRYPQNSSSGVYSTQFPTDPLGWHYEKTCGSYRMTSSRWVSKKLEEIKGFSIKGLVYKRELGGENNEFAVFFHQKRCYGGGPEYGWVFKENSFEGLFYLCADCNKDNQKWFQWPGYNANASGEVEEIKKALKNTAVYQYWNIKITQSGDFVLELINPATWQYHSCTIKKPDWFPNVYKTSGYMTITAQKLSEKNRNSQSYIHIDEVKVLK